jgi:hypothetical protein
MLSVITLSVVVLSDVMLKLIMLCVIMLSVFMLSVVIPSVIVLLVTTLRHVLKSVAMLSFVILIIPPSLKYLVTNICVTIQKQR